ncbi:MAG TPA: NAD(P)-dependent oxidoreductase [Burkholderiaceae bacterium]|nr:NAD(P)-dependent oxidoreductase [Burkholderiaceae bacterium]
MKSPSAPSFRHWSGRRVLVTGHRGFIGASLSQRLLEAGANLHGVSRSEDGVDASNFPIVRCDLSHSEDCRRAITQTQPDCIIHLAGHPFAARNLERVLPTLRDNLVATVNLLAAAAEVRTGRVLITGSLEEPNVDVDPAPSSPYAASKWAASVYARMFHRIYSLPVVIARLFMVYGPGQSEPTKLIPSVIAALSRGQAPQISSGERLVDWVYIDDVVTGMLIAAETDGLDGRTIDIGTGVLTTVSDVVRQLATLFPGAPPPLFGSVESRAFEQIRAADIKTTRQALNWVPRINLSEGLAATVAGARAAQYSASP